MTTVNEQYSSKSVLNVTGEYWELSCLAEVVVGERLL